MEKCLICLKKKIIITDCKCMCKMCLRCLHSHSCSFDYSQLRSKIIKVTADKISKI